MNTMMQLSQVCAWLADAQPHGSCDRAVLRVHTDTRTIEPGDLFVAIKGDRFDANTLLLEAEHRGAVAAICHADAPRDALTTMTCLVVPDTRRALGQLATAWRAQFTLPLIAVTGSNGKTTVTQMLAAILCAHRPGDGSLATLGNFNNDIGVPLTLLRLRPHHQIAVVELGMNHPGEIAQLAAMAQPTVAIVNNAQREHLEFMQTVRAVALENGSVINAVPPSGTVVFPSDDDHTSLWHTLAGHRRQWTFALQGTGGAQELVATQAHWEHGAWQIRAQGLGQDLQYRLSIAGRHNVKNSLAAAAAALAAGVPSAAVVHGLEAFVPVKGRSRALMLSVDGREVTLVDDTYNANPDSVRAAIDVLADLPGPRLLVLGDMGEVGQQGPQFHAEAGRYAKAKGVTFLAGVGELAQVAVEAFEGAGHSLNMDQLIDTVLGHMPRVRSVLVKGSRFMRMERVVDALMPYAVKNQERRRAP